VSTNGPPDPSLVGSLYCTRTRAVRWLFFCIRIELTETLAPVAVSPTGCQSPAANATRLTSSTGVSTTATRIVRAFFKYGGYRDKRSRHSRRKKQFCQPPPVHIRLPMLSLLAQKCV